MWCVRVGLMLIVVLVIKRNRSGCGIIRMISTILIRMNG